MDLLQIVLLVAAGVAGGIMAAIVGGAAVFTFPAMLAVGLPPVMATAGNTIALTPGLFIAAYYDRTQLLPFDRAFMAMVLASVAGGLSGAALLVVTPERVFAGLVPLLLGFATVLFACAGRISTWLATRTPAAHGKKAWIASAATLLPVSIYGGYFGAGLGVLVLGVLSVATGGNYRSANTTKNLVTGINSSTATVMFAWQDVVPWPATLLMMAGTLVGGLIGARLAQVMPNHAARRLVVFVGALLTAIFAWRYWI
jgi:uncharacterized protein